MAAKTQAQHIVIFITRIDMSSTFNTICRDKLFKIAEEFMDEDDMRILSTLLAETTLEVKVENAQATTLNLTSDHLKEAVLVVHSSHCTSAELSNR